MTSRNLRFPRSRPAPVPHFESGVIAELLHARAQIAGHVVAVVPGKVLASGRHHVLGLGLQLDRPLTHRRRRLLVAAGDGRPVALHHLVGHAAPQHCLALIHEAGEEGVRLVVGDACAMIHAAVQRDVDAEGEEAHGGESTPPPAERLLI